MKKYQSGFTLVEIAIVLVIIGLLLGGVLKGQEMITQAKIKNVINDFNGTASAYYSYQDRYRAIPGDDVGAAARWPAPAGPTNAGDGNAIVAGAYNVFPADTPTAAQESNLFWQHLRLAGFVAGPTTGAGSGTPPANAAGGITGVQNSGMGLNGLIVCSSNLPAKIAASIDSQFDDGNATSNQVLGALQAAGASNLAVPAVAPAANYVDTGGNQYTVCKNI